MQTAEHPGHVVIVPIAICARVITAMLVLMQNRETSPAPSSGIKYPAPHLKGISIITAWSGFKIRL